jgi:hypothetical protein
MEGHKSLPYHFVTGELKSQSHTIYIQSLKFIPYKLEKGLMVKKIHDDFNLKYVDVDEPNAGMIRTRTILNIISLFSNLDKDQQKTEHACSMH